MLERPLTCPVLIGRTEALAAVGSAAAQARAGKGQVLLLAGEAGIGKSRLVREVREAAAADGMALLQGNCFESDRALPYAPLLDLLRNFCHGRSAAEVSEAFSPWSAHLARLLPELGTLVSGGTLPDVPDPGQEKRDLFYAMTQVVIRLAGRQPLLLIIEDLHFADDSSLDALLYIARHAVAEPVLTLLTYRLDEVRPGLGHFLAQLDRERLAFRLRLEPLSIDEVASMLRATLDLNRPWPSDAVQALYSLTEGNPFFVEEVLQSLAAMGTISASGQTGETITLHGLQALAAAPGIQDAVQRRVERLGAGARRVLTLAAIAGRRFDFAILQDLAQTDEAGLLGTIKEAIAAQLVVEESPEIFAFRHELTRQAILAGLLARERRGLHARVAEALARMPAAPLPDLAYHAYHAEDWPNTLDYARRAGEQALALYAPRAAAEQFTRALDAAGRLGLSPGSALFASRGRAYEILGEFDRARQDYASAVQAAQAAGDRRAEWAALLSLGFLWAGRSYAMAHGYLQQALALAQEIGDPAMQAHSLNRIGNWHLNQEQPVEAAGHHREAQRIFTEIGDESGLAEALDLLGSASHFSGDQLQAAQHFSKAIGLFRRLGDRRGLISALVSSIVTGPNYMTDTTVTAEQDLEQALRDGDETLKIAGAMGWQAGEAMALFLTAYWLGWHGFYSRGLARAQRALYLAEEIDHRQWIAAAHGALGALCIDLLALPAAYRHLEQALALAQEAGSPIFVAETAGSLGLAYILGHDYRRAEAVLAVALSSRSAPLTLGQRLVVAGWAELALARQEPGQALELTDRLIASAPNAPGVTVPRLAFLRGRTLAALGRTDESTESLRAARAAAAAQGGRPLLWRIELALGKLYRKMGQGGLASERFQAARDITGRLAAEIPDRELQADFTRQVEGLLPHPHMPPSHSERDAFGGLTARERQVATLVAEGKSNHQIAEALVLSERTVEGHISSILSRLGFASRAQIAAWAAERRIGQQAPRT
jgi:DNA-binding CsgD family transcriptional regulator